MKTFLLSVAGVDVHKTSLTITVIFEKSGKQCEETWEGGTFTDDLVESGKKILSFGIKEVAMESTGIYWKPVVNVWSKLGLHITLGNAYHIKKVPGRKTDVKDSQWLAQLHRSGLIRASYLPEKEFQEMRILTRHRNNIINDNAKLKCRIQKILEDGNIKLSSVISDVFGVAGQAVLTAIIKGKDHPDDLVKLIQTNVKESKEVIRKSLKNTLTNEHRMVLNQLYSVYLLNEQMIKELDDGIYKKMLPYKDHIQKLSDIPGIKTRTAEIILAEATTKMDQFKDAKTFAAWAGVAPGNNESAKKKRNHDAEKATLP